MRTDTAPRPRRPRGNFHQVRAPLLFLLPNLLIFLLFIIIPAFQGLGMSLFSRGIFTPAKYVGLRNFQRLLGDRVFLITVQNTLVYSLAAVALMTPWFIAAARVDANDHFVSDVAASSVLVGVLTLLLARWLRQQARA